MKKLLSIKDLMQLPQEKRLFGSIYGADFDQEAVGFVYTWSLFLPRKADVEGTARYQEAKKRMIEAADGLFRYFIFQIEPKLNDAIARKDGAFFRKLADAIERNRKPLDRLRATIALNALVQKQDILPGAANEDLKTAAEWLGHLEKKPSSGFIMGKG